MYSSREHWKGSAAACFPHAVSSNDSAVAFPRLCWSCFVFLGSGIYLKQVVHSTCRMWIVTQYAVMQTCVESDPPVVEEGHVSRGGYKTCPCVPKTSSFNTSTASWVLVCLSLFGEPACGEQKEVSFCQECCHLGLVWTVHS
jgi:hypothetical protein